MFLVRAAILIVLILILLPSNGEERYALYTTAQRTVSDIGSFCSRNKDVCNRVSSAIEGIGRKLKSATDSIEDLLRDAGIGAPRDRRKYSGNNRNVDDDSTASLSSASDTLKKDDLAPIWRGPARQEILSNSLGPAESK